MKGGCPLEPQVLRAMQQDLWTALLRDHVGGCEDCQALVAIGPWMDRFAAVEDREHILPDPAVLLLKARLLKATSAADRAARPITNLHVAAYIIVGTCWAAMFAWKWSVIDEWLSGLALTHLMRGEVNGQSLSMSFFFAIFVLSSATVILALHTILAEE